MKTKVFIGINLPGMSLTALKNSLLAITLVFHILLRHTGNTFSVMCQSLGGTLLFA